MNFKSSTFISVLLWSVFTVQAQKKAIPPTDSSGVDQKVDVPATFPGGSKGWTMYLMQNLTYPAQAVQKRTQGTVNVAFVVNEKGKVSDVHALNDPGNGLAQEAERLLKKSPKWEPAKINNQNVVYKHTQTITFRLE